MLSKIINIMSSNIFIQVFMLLLAVSHFLVGNSVIGSVFLVGSMLVGVIVNNTKGEKDDL